MAGMPATAQSYRSGRTVETQPALIHPRRTFFIGKNNFLVNGRITINKIRAVRSYFDIILLGCLPTALFY
jgi:hypothetical protein